MKTQKQPLATPLMSTIAAISIFYGVIIIMFTAVQWIIIDFLGPFLVGPLLLCLWSGFLILLPGSIIYFIFQFNKNIKKACLPLLINVFTILILVFVPFTAIWLNIEFRLNKNAYDEVIKMVENGELQPNSIGLTRLPPEYRRISRGGDIVVDKQDHVTSVFFYTYRGVLDNFSGYMYRSDNSFPPPDFMGGDWVQVERKQPKWFFCASK